jgi:hypothetical protein
MHFQNATLEGLRSDCQEQQMRLSDKVLHLSRAQSVSRLVHSELRLIYGRPNLDPIRAVGRVLQAFETPSPKPPCIWHYIQVIFVLLRHSDVIVDRYHMLQDTTIAQ